MKFLLKPSNTRVNLDINTTKVSDIFNSRSHTASLKKSGDPIGPPDRLLKDCDLVENDFLWKIDQPDFDLESFLHYLVEDFSKLSEKLSINKNLAARTGTLEFSLFKGQSLQAVGSLSDNSVTGSGSYSNELVSDASSAYLNGTVVISNNRGNTLNIIFEIGDLTEAQQKPLSFQTLEESVYFLKSSLSQYLKNPVSGIFSVPNQVLFKIANYLDGPSLLNLAKTCKRFKTICYNEELWKNLIKREFPVRWQSENYQNLTSSSQRMDAFHSHSSWRLQYGKLYKVNEISKKEAQKRRALEEERRRILNENNPGIFPMPGEYPRGGVNTHPDNYYPDRSRPRGEFPGMIGGVSDVDPFSSLRDDRNPMRPRGDPFIHGPGNPHQPGPGRGLGSDDDIYTQPGFPPLGPGNHPFGRGRGRGPGNPGNFGGGFF